MNEYEWTVGLILKAPDVRGLRGSRRGPVAEHVPLLFPRENMAWVMKTEPDREPKRPAAAQSKAATSVKRKSAET